MEEVPKEIKRARVSLLFDHPFSRVSRYIWNRCASLICNPRRWEQTDVTCFITQTLSRKSQWQSCRV